MTGIWAEGVVVGVVVTVCAESAEDGVGNSRAAVRAVAPIAVDPIVNAMVGAAVVVGVERAEQSDGRGLRASWPISVWIDLENDDVCAETVEDTNVVAAVALSDAKELAVWLLIDPPGRASVICPIEFRFEIRICPRGERATRRTAQNAPMATTALALEGST